MGTSKSSTGPASGVPLVPPWVPDPVPPDEEDQRDPKGDQDVPNSESQPVLVAPKARFGPARVNLGVFARTGGSNEMHRGLGHYVNKGMGGAATATRRMGATVRTAGALYGALSSSATGQAAAPGSPFDPTLLTGKSAHEVMDALVEAVRPVDGTQDAEVSRRAICDAVAELLNQFPEANLLELSEEQRVLVIERYVALDVYNRFYLDLGKTVQDKAPSPIAALERLKDIKNYIKESVSGSFRALRKAGERLGVRPVAVMVRQVLRKTFGVFEEYVR